MARLGIITGAAAALLLAAPGPAHQTVPTGANRGAASLVAHPAMMVVDGFHAALRRGDSQAALLFLAEDAVIFEGGGVEASKAEYAAHHAAADAQFSRAVTARQERRWFGAERRMAWVATESRISGSFRGRTFNGRKMTETMVLKRSGGRWRISHIHWSMAD